MSDVLESQSQKIGVREFRGNLAAILRQAQLGQSFLVMSHDKVLAELGPPPPTRQAGVPRGKICATPDFDALPTDILYAMAR